MLRSFRVLNTKKALCVYWTIVKNILHYLKARCKDYLLWSMKIKISLFDKDKLEDVLNQLKNLNKKVKIEGKSSQTIQSGEVTYAHVLNKVPLVIVKPSKTGT